VVVGRPSLQPGSTFGDELTITGDAAGEGATDLVDATRGDAHEPVTLQVFTRLTPHGALGRKRFMDAALSSRSADSDHVPKVVDAGVDATSGAAWIATERLEGRRLDEVLRQRGHLTSAEVGEILGQVAHGLDAAHTQGIVHGALRPETIFLGKSRRAGSGVVVKLLQIGIAPLLHEVDDDGPRTQSTWAAPELSEADHVADATADVWSMGLLAFHLLSGRSYWKSLSAVRTETVELMRESLVGDLVAASTRADEIDAPSKLPLGFDAWFARCVARDPIARYPSAGAAIDVLRPILNVREPFESSPESFLRSPDADSELAAPEPSPVPELESEVPPLLESEPSPVPELESEVAKSPSLRAPIADPFHDAVPVPSQPSPPPRRKRWMLVGATLLVLTLGGAAAVILLWPTLWQGQATTAAVEESEGEQDEENHHRRPSGIRRAVEHHQLAPVPVSADDAQWGSPVAPVTIVEFGDFRSRSCKTLTSVLSELKRDYGSGRLRVVWKHRPLTPSARAAAEAARVVLLLGGEEAFWKFHDTLFERRDEFAEARFAAWAEDAGVSRDDFLRDFEWNHQSPRVERDIELSKQIGARPPPGLFVNGIRVFGKPSYRKLRDLIDKQLNVAKAERRGGTAPEDVYVVLATKNYQVAPKLRRRTGRDALWNVPVLADDPGRGASDALVTIIEFGDFQSSRCDRARPALDEILEEYEDDLRFVWKDQPEPLTEGRQAAVLARLVYDKFGEDAFWRAHDELFEDSPTDSDELRLIALKSGLDWSAIESEVERGEHPKVLASSELAKRLRNRTAPTFFVNGRRLAGVMGTERWRMRIDEALQSAELLVLSGTPRAKVYEVTVESGKSPSDAL